MASTTSVPATSPGSPAPLARVAVAVLVILAAGFVGLVGAFSDPFPGESLALRLTFMAAVHFGSAALVGFLLPRRWYVAVLTAWGPMLLGGVGLYVKLRFPESPGRVTVSLAMLLVVPTVALLGGFLGKWWARHRR